MRYILRRFQAYNARRFGRGRCSNSSNRYTSLQSLLKKQHDVFVIGSNTSVIDLNLIHNNHANYLYFSTLQVPNSDSNLDVSESEKIVRPQVVLAEDKRSSIEDKYTRKTPIEHVLLRPGMYVGPNERLPPTPHWVLETTPSVPTEDLLNVAKIDPVQIQEFVQKMEQNTTKDTYRFVSRECSIVPALVKIFDEILVNASDNRLRNPESSTRIDVIIDPGCHDSMRGPFIMIYNDGHGIPVHMHEAEKMYVPELVFGHMLTGSNFDDSEERMTGGRHGYGAKLANIFSKLFVVETVDTTRRLKYKQSWSNNMSVSNTPEISKVKKGKKVKDYTCVSFVPDIGKLTGQADMTTISEEDYAIMCRRVMDIAGCGAGQIIVTLNGRNVSQSTFAEYLSLYRRKESQPLLVTSINPRWTVGVGLSENGSFESVSFVNGISTSRGGTHVNSLTQQLTKHIQDHVEKKYPELSEFVTQQLIRRHLFVGCDARIVNPTFDSQMKENLTSSPNTFGSSCTLSPAFLTNILKLEDKGGPGIIEEIIRVAKGREQMNLLKDFSGKKSKRQLLSIPKLEDAHDAGSTNGSECTLILTEGDSAKALAVAGLEVIGRKQYGVFPLRGKLLNVRDAPISQLGKNAEIKALCSIIGLDFEKEYSTIAERHELRYGHVMLMTDQDTDGSHIKGLVINFFRLFWPKLLQPPVDVPTTDEWKIKTTFMSYFVTPLLKAAKKGTKIVRPFYSMTEFKTWYEKLSIEEQNKWNIKYYKGLGTSTPSEAKEYFKAFDKHVRTFQWCSESDGEHLDMAFDKKRAADRREWILETYSETSDIIANEEAGNTVSYEDFINKEMIHFSHADNIRSIPHFMDGLKPSQRKVLFACFKRKLNAEIKVAQLSGYCAEHTAYHHGEASLQSTIIGMAQDFVGANNINLLIPSGQFGTRFTGGVDAASPRYIFTYLSPVARLLFPEADDILLQYLEEDGQRVEPEFFYPIIPFILVNGSQGIGTGWSTFIPPYNPRDLINHVLAKLDNIKELHALRPFARNFEGTIEPNNNGNGFVTHGRASVVNKRTILIDELPLNMWTSKFKDYLLSMRNKSLITSFVENHTTTKVSFTVTLQPNQVEKMAKKGLEEAFNLRSFLPTSNMYAFDANNQLKKFERAEDIINEFFPMRMALYEHRKSVFESEMRYLAKLHRNRARFIEAVTKGVIDLVGGRTSKTEAAAALKRHGFDTRFSLESIRHDNSLRSIRKSAVENPQGDLSEEGNEDEFQYLLGMPLSSLTSEKIEELHRDALRREEELEKVRSLSASDLWREDLNRLLNHV